MNNHHETTSPREPVVPAPAFDGRAFRQCLGQFATGVTIMTAQAGDVRVGVTANSFSSLSLDPPLVLWSIKRTSRSLQAFEDATHFGVNILSTHQVELSQRFAGSAPDKFDGVAWSPSAAGVPLIDGVVAHIECERYATLEGGDHLILVGKVVRFASFQRDVLLFVQGQYGIAGRHPDMQPQTVAAAPSGTAGAEPSPLSFSGLLYWAHYYFSEGFAAYRRAENLTLAQSRLLFVISEFPCLDTETLVLRSYIEETAAKDALAELDELGLASVDAGRWRITPEGEARRKLVRRRQTEFESRELATLDETDASVTRRFLTDLVAQLKRRFDK